MGDPETESVMPRIESDLVELLLGVAEGNLNEKELIISNKVAATVVCVAGGDPRQYLKNKAISGIENVRGSHVFQAGTKQQGEDILAVGGRVLAITSLQDNMFDAL